MINLLNSFQTFSPGENAKTESKDSARFDEQFVNLLTLAIVAQPVAAPIVVHNETAADNFESKNLAANQIAVESQFSTDSPVGETTISRLTLQTNNSNVKPASATYFETSEKNAVQSPDSRANFDSSINQMKNFDQKIPLSQIAAAPAENFSLAAQTADVKLETAPLAQTPNLVIKSEPAAILATPNTQIQLSVERQFEVLSTNGVSEANRQFAETSGSEDNRQFTDSVIEVKNTDQVLSIGAQDNKKTAAKNIAQFAPPDNFELLLQPKSSKPDLEFVKKIKEIIKDLPSPLKIQASGEVDPTASDAQVFKQNPDNVAEIDYRTGVEKIVREPELLKQTNFFAGKTNIDAQQSAVVVPKPSFFGEFSIFKAVSAAKTNQKNQTYFSIANLRLENQPATAPAENQIANVQAENQIANAQRANDGLNFSTKSFDNQRAESISQDRVSNDGQQISTDTDQGNFESFLRKTSDVFNQMTFDLPFKKESSSLKEKLENKTSLQNLGENFALVNQNEKARENIVASDKQNYVRDVSTEVLEQIAKPLFALNKESVNVEPQTIRLKLNPEELGAVEIRLETTASGKLSAKLTAGTEVAKQVLAENINHLQSALENSGWQVERLEVSLGQNGGGNGGGFANSHHSSSQQTEPQKFEQSKLGSGREVQIVQTIETQSTKIVSVRA